MLADARRRHGIFSHFALARWSLAETTAGEPIGFMAMPLPKGACMAEMRQIAAYLAGFRGRFSLTPAFVRL